MSWLLMFRKLYELDCEEAHEVNSLERQGVASSLARSFARTKVAENFRRYDSTHHSNTDSFTLWQRHRTLQICPN